MNRPDEAREAALTEYLDGTLTPEARARLEAELAADAAIAGALQHARAGRDLLQGLERRRPPGDFLRRTRRRLRRRSTALGLRRPGELLGSRLSVEAFAILAIVLMAAVYMLLESERTVGPLYELPAPESVAPPPPHGPRSQ